MCVGVVVVSGIVVVRVGCGWLEQGGFLCDQGGCPFRFHNKTHRSLGDTGVGEEGLVAMLGQIIKDGYDLGMEIPEHGVRLSRPSVSTRPKRSAMAPLARRLQARKKPRLGLLKGRGTPFKVGW